MVFEKYEPRSCRNHKNKVATHYETESKLYFCADCINGLSKAKPNDLRVMAGLEPLDHLKEPLSENREREKNLEEERKAREERLKKDRFPKALEPPKSEPKVLVPPPAKYEPPKVNGPLKK